MTREIAVLHGTLTAQGGAERVAAELARTFDAPLYAGIIDSECVPSDINAHQVLDGVPERLHQLHPMLADLVDVLAWQHHDDLRDYDTIIRSGTTPGWFVPGDHQTVVQYAHGLRRGRYDQFPQHASLPSRVIKTGMRALSTPNQRYPDRYVANSDLVARRLHQYWGIPQDQIDVVYPPVDVADYDATHASGDADGSYLTLGRLAGHKRIGELVDAFHDLPNRELVVAGDGPERDQLEARAPENVTFRGYVDERKKQQLLANARAFLMNAANEDFGMTVIEAFASGTPVLGVEDGFTQHQIIDGENGYTYPRGGVAAAIQQYERVGVDWTPERIAEFAERFNTRRFRRELETVVEQAQETAAVAPDWQDTASGRSQAGSWDGVRAVADGGEHVDN